MYSKNANFITNISKQILHSKKLPNRWCVKILLSSLLLLLFALSLLLILLILPPFNNFRIFASLVLSSIVAKNGESFGKTSDWQVILPEWVSYVSKQFDKEVDDDAMVKKNRKDNTYTLKMGKDGFPILLDHAEMDSDTQKAVVRAFLNWHYRKFITCCFSGPSDSIDRGLQWQAQGPGALEGSHTKARQAHSSAIYSGWKKIQEPSRMNWDEATKLLDFCKADKEVKSPIAQMGEPDVDEEDEQPKKTPRGKRRTGISTRRKSTSQVVVPVDSSNKDEDSARKIKPAAKAVKGRVKLTKTAHASKSQVDSEGSADDFNGEESSDKSLDDEMPTASKGKEPAKHKARRPRKKNLAPKPKKVPEADAKNGTDEPEESRLAKKPKPAKQAVLGMKVAPEKPPHTTPAEVLMVDELVNMAKGTDAVQDPSASQAPPTPLDKPRRVGPASRPGGTLRKKTAPHQIVGEPNHGKKCGPEGGLEGSPKKRTRVEHRGKKHVAEDPLEGSPAKCTRSKMTEDLPKRSKKPNSKYAADCVQS
ncbi:hypothetical protein EV702DRAFT_1049011 [Suillus placidus]|uniref:Uncharacterized protein n=1 Tax=Suillus placidus TaxID=48579 RepID=A0A9P6ZM25_9AGAM|nr:hypothetical protein EV702DRAFT_1049011 [Suillus placidus]